MRELHLSRLSQLRDLRVHLDDQFSVSRYVQPLLFHHLLQVRHYIRLPRQRELYSLHVLHPGPPRVLRESLSHARLINIVGSYVPEPFSDKLQILYYRLVFGAKRKPFQVDEGDLAVLFQYDRNDRVVSLLSQVDADVVIFRRYTGSRRLTGCVIAQFLAHLRLSACSGPRRTLDCC